MFAEIRYESALFIVPVLAVLLLFRMLSWSTLRPYALMYAATPALFAVAPVPPRRRLGGRLPRRPRVDHGAIRDEARREDATPGKQVRPVVTEIEREPGRRCRVPASAVRNGVGQDWIDISTT